MTKLLRVGVLPNSLDLRPLRHISPSRFESLKECALKEIWTASRQPALLPPSPAGVVGGIAHRLLEDAGSGRLAGGDQAVAEKRWEELVVAWEREMQRSWLERAAVPLKRTVADYEVRRIRACRKAVEIARNVSDLHYVTQRSHGTRFEFWLQSKDGLLGGFVDEVQEATDGVILRDYKSGYIFDRDENDNSFAVKKSYQTQLRIYAALYQSTFGRWPVSLVITPLQGPDEKITFYPSDCEALVKEAIIRLKDINATIAYLTKSVGNATDCLATPSASVCRFCRFRPGCSAYHKTRDSDADSFWPIDVWGTVTDIHTLGNGRPSLSLQVENRSYSQAHIRGFEQTLESPAAGNIREGDKIAIYNLKSSRSSPEMYTEGLQTVVYQIEGDRR